MSYFITRTYKIVGGLFLEVKNKTFFKIRKFVRTLVFA